MEDLQEGRMGADLAKVHVMGISEAHPTTLVFTREVLILHALAHGEVQVDRDDDEIRRHLVLFTPDIDCRKSSQSHEYLHRRTNLLMCS